MHCAMALMHLLHGLCPSHWRCVSEVDTTKIEVTYLDTLLLAPITGALNCRCYIGDMIWCNGEIKGTHHGFLRRRTRIEAWWGRNITFKSERGIASHGAWLFGDVTSVVLCK